MGADKMVATAAGLMLIPMAAWLIDFLLQYKGMVEGAERINVLNIRVALFLPFYALFMFIGCASPNALPAMNIFLALTESYSFYCFFVLLVTNLGGANQFVAAMKAANRELACCNSCCPKDMQGMYDGVCRALWHLIITRNILTVVAVIGNYSGTRAGKAVYAVLGGVCTILLFNALIRIFLTYEVVYAQCQNVFNVWKVLLLKFSIGLLVLEGLIAEFMVSFNAEPYDDDDTHDAEDKTYRGYTSLVLIEYAIMSLPYLCLWAMKVTPPAAGQGDKAVTTAPLTFGEYLCRVTALWDIFGLLGTDNSLNQPLTEPVTTRV